ncbi:MAG: hypothetical protein JWQ23_2513 [Herminiimonas sp.]|nr:hypothetical protein [Herminiimonas sp.]
MSSAAAVACVAGDSNQNKDCSKVIDAIFRFSETLGEALSSEDAIERIVPGGVGKEATLLKALENARQEKGELHHMKLEGTLGWPGLMRTGLDKILPEIRTGNRNYEGVLRLAVQSTADVLELLSSELKAKVDKAANAGGRTGPEIRESFYETSAAGSTAVRKSIDELSVRLRPTDKKSPGSPCFIYV